MNALRPKAGTLPRRLVAILCVAAGAVVSASAQMADPAIDRDDEPFCYFSSPVDVIGVMDGPEGTLVSPEGYLYTGYGELMFFAGRSLQPVSQRVKTLANGFLPIICFSFTRDGIRYDMEMFGATLDGNPESPLMNFVRARLTNIAGRQQRAFFAAAVRHQNEENTDWGFGDHRFSRPAAAETPGGYAQAGTTFNRNWEYVFRDDAFLRDGAVLYLFPLTPAPRRMMTLTNGGNEVPGQGPQNIPCLPTTPTGVVVYDPILPPKGTVDIVLKMPYAPLPPADTILAMLRNASYDDYRRRTVLFWQNLLGRGIDIDIPERKVADAFKANLVYDLIARNRENGQYIQKVNEFQYDAFWLRDATYIARMYDLSGYGDIARQCIDYFARWQQPDGNFLSQPGQLDGWGQVLWSYGQHYRFNRDTGFARSVYPAVLRAFEWLKKTVAADAASLFPPSTPGDNENISGRITGHNFWALAGIRNAVAIAEAVGEPGDAAQFVRAFDDLKAALLRRIGTLTPRTAGAIPPGLDSLGGQDWGNMMSITPEILLDPSDPLVSATLRATRAKYQEGLMTYGDGRWLHHYITMDNTETELIRGEQKAAIEDLYAVLLHTSATHAGFEFYILPWGTRDFGMNLSPHGWFSAKYRTLLRNMLLREEGNDLHLFSALSPEWLDRGKTVSVRRAPTYFGAVDAALAAGEGGATVTVNADWKNAPASIVIHIPWCVKATAARVDGASVGIDQNTLRCPPGTRSVTISWTKIAHRDEMSFERSVKEYRKEYRRRYDDWIGGRD